MHRLLLLGHVAYKSVALFGFIVICTTSRGPKWGTGGQWPGVALLVKRRNRKWSFTNEPEVRFSF